MTVIKAEQRQIQELWSGSQYYRVPPFQRSYSWSKDNAQELYDDIMQNSLDKGENHFIGSMIFSKENNKYLNVLDGQQRFSTILILLASLRDVLVFIGEKDNVLSDLCNKKISLIENKALFSEDSITGEKHPKLKLNKRDHTYFSEILQKKTGNISEKKWARGSRKSHKLIYEVYCFFFDKFFKQFGTITDDSKLKEKIEKLMNAIYSHLIFIEISVGDESDANKIFESINHKGVRLSGADLIKNYIFSEFQDSADDEELNDLIEDWDNLSDSGIDVVRFIRHYWLSNFEDKVSKDDVFPKVKKYVKDNGNIKKLLKNLFEAARVYQNCDTPTDEFWEENISTKNFVQQLRVLGTEQSMILLLAAYDVYYAKGDFSSFEKIINLLEVFVFRRNTICHKDAKELESLYSTIAKDLRKGKININGIQEKLKEKIPDDKEFLSSFEMFDTQNSELAKYILTKIYQSDLRDLVIDRTKLHWEHIIPKKFLSDNDWKKVNSILKEQESELLLGDVVDKLGNFTLLLPGDNIKAQNKGFKVKCEEAYSISSMPANKVLSEMDNFGVIEVIERQKKFAEIAVKLWKL